MNRIKDDIKQRKFHNLYLLYGSEELLKKNYRENLKHFILENSDEMNFSKFENRGVAFGALSPKPSSPETGPCSSPTCSKPLTL